MNTKIQFSRCLTYGAIMMAIAIASGAFGAHGLKNILDEKSLSIYEIATKYLIYHAFGLFILGFISLHISNKMLKIAKITMLLGIFIFSGSLYALSFSGYTILGAITPIGGFLLILSWVILALALNKKDN